MKFTHSFKKNLALGLLFACVFVFTQAFSTETQAQSTGLQGQQISATGLGGLQQGTTGTTGATGQIGGTTNNLGLGGLTSNAPCLANEYNVHGEIWSSTAGWIYLNCNDFVGTSVTGFGVNEDSQGYWTGDGWSPNIGWIQFGNNGCPAGITANMTSGIGDDANCDVMQVATHKGSGSPSNWYYPVVGWARALTAKTDSSDSGAWDGWISMSGYNDQNPNGTFTTLPSDYGVQGGAAASYTTTISGGMIKRALYGYVWGADVVSWGQFKDAYVLGPLPVVAHVALSVTPTSQSVGTSGGGISLTYSAATQADEQYFTDANCSGTFSTANDTTGGWEGTSNLTGTLLSTGGSSPYSYTKTGIGLISTLPIGTYTFTISCPVSSAAANPGGVATNSVNFAVTAATPPLVVNAPSIVYDTTPFQLSYSINDTSNTADIADEQDFDGSQNCGGSIWGPVQQGLNDASADVSDATWTYQSSATPNLATATTEPATPLTTSFLSTLTSGSTYRFVMTCPLVGGGTDTAYQDVTLSAVPLAQISLTADSNTVHGSAPVTLTYSTPAADQQYFTGACTGSATPANNTSGGWESNQLTDLSSQASESLPVVMNGPGAYTFSISCPVTIPGSTQTSVTATTQVTDVSGTVNLSSASNDLCQNPSNGPTSTTLTWSSSGTTSYCKLSANGSIDLKGITYAQESGPFDAGEVVTGLSSGATATVASDASGTLIVSPLSGTFTHNEQIKGGTSGSTATVGSYSQELPPSATIPVGPFSQPTSGTLQNPNGPNGYQTPSATTPNANGNNANEYVMKCFDVNGSEYDSGPVYVGVAPATFNATTSNGPLDCVDSPFSINLSGQNTILCGTQNPVTLSWSNSGTLPAQYTNGYAELYKTSSDTNPPDFQNSPTPVNGTDTGLTDSTTVSAPGSYWLYYFAQGSNVPSSVYGGPIDVTQNTGTICHGFTPPGSAGLLCPSYVGQSYPWSATTGATCTQDGTTVAPDPNTGVVNGAIVVGNLSTGQTQSDTVECSWAIDGTHASSNTSYGPMQSSCTNVPPPGTVSPPKIIEE